jgi:hypothetical protein
MLPRDSEGVERCQVSGLASRLHVEFRADALRRYTCSAPKLSYKISQAMFCIAGSAKASPNQERRASLTALPLQAIVQ